ncbi:MAG: hypothetical protein DHS80DRAFT_28540 [Piptocephalis tieghemiana]|nr:MAG: hypothetical protein DHS80DRAFT_28540 [Piptocephalis tieghemiana]
MNLIRPGHDIPERGMEHHEKSLTLPPERVLVARMKERPVGPDQRPVSVIWLDQEGRFTHYPLIFSECRFALGPPLVPETPGVPPKITDEGGHGRELQLYWYPSFYCEGLSAHRFVQTRFVRSPSLSPSIKYFLPAGQSILPLHQDGSSGDRWEGSMRGTRFPWPFKLHRSRPIHIKLQAPRRGRRLPIRHEGIYHIQGKGWRMDYRVMKYEPSPQDLYRNLGPPSPQDGEENEGRGVEQARGEWEKVDLMVEGENEERGEGGMRGGMEWVRGRRLSAEWRGDRLSGERWVEVRSIRISLSLMAQAVEQAEHKSRGKSRLTTLVQRCMGGLVGKDGRGEERKKKSKESSMWRQGQQIPLI